MPRREKSEVPREVLILGAGAAGLMAWNRLRIAGISATIIEARERTGGRIVTLHRPEVHRPMELGAEFVHGRPEILLKLLCRARLKYTPVPDERLIAAGNGKLAPLDAFWEIIEKIDSQIPKHREMPYAKFLEAAQGSPFEKEIARSFVEGFNAADANCISTSAVKLEDDASSESEGEKQYRLAKGYDSLIKHLTAQIPPARLQLGAIAKEIRWEQGRVEIHVERKSETVVFTGASALITLPLGVLRAKPGAEGAVRFRPGIPQKQKAWQCMEMGHVEKIIVRFERRFWKRRGKLGFIMAPGAEIPVWWPLDSQPALVGWAGGPQAKKLAGLPAQELEDRAFSSLEGIFGMKASQLKQMMTTIHRHDWSNDPFSLGAYSYQRVGGIAAARTLARPVKSTLFFAGEATDFEGHSGTVHAALESGIRAAKEIISRRK